MKAFWTFTLARLAVLAVTFAAVWGVSSIWLETNQITVLWMLLVALVISSVVSIFLLAGLRQKVAENVAERAARMTERIEEARRAEDID